MFRRASIALLSAVLPLGATAEAIYRCESAAGVSYQQLPCASSAAGTIAKVPTTFPPVNVVERDRLLAREAALDARLLKRAEIESKERMAYAALRARELELQAERERARESEPVYVVSWMAPRPLRRPRARIASGFR
jgi:hypothetical protein